MILSIVMELNDATSSSVQTWPDANGTAPKKIMRISASTAMIAMAMAKKYPLKSIGNMDVNGMLDLRRRMVLRGLLGDSAMRLYGEWVCTSSQT
jgi:hypothetical protein